MRMAIITLNVEDFDKFHASTAIDSRWIGPFSFLLIRKRIRITQQVDMDIEHFHRKSDTSSWHDRHSRTHMYQSANEVNGDKNRVSDFLFFYFRRIRVTFLCVCRVTTTIKLPIITRLLNRFRYFKYFVSSSLSAAQPLFKIRFSISQRRARANNHNKKHSSSSTHTHNSTHWWLHFR